MIRLETEEIQFSDGRTITISENDWDMARKLSRLTEEAALSVNGGTSALDYFRKNLYPVMAAPASGEVPDAFAAFSLSREDLDRWYIAVWKKNPDWFTEEYTEEQNVTTVTFRDGSTLTLSESQGLPSFVLRLAELEDDAITNPSEDKDAQLFRLVFYPKMAACVVGEVPPADEVRKWPSTEINKWYEAAAQTNPDWFRGLIEITPEAIQAAEEKDKQEKKKGVRKRAG